MQRRLDDQRRINPNESFPRVLAPAGQRMGEVGDNIPPSNIQFPMQSYQVNQGGHPSPSLHHAMGGVQAPPPTHHPAQVLPAQLPAAGPTQPPATQAAGAVNLELFSHAAQVQGQQQQQQQFQRLKVEDALSYLDQVKLQFGNQPQVYNDFLDIMKEFKSQTIDTPGVINRVSNLFKGHPDLIVGFNTFLPPGYKIEVQSETINVHQPGHQVISISAGAVLAPTPQPSQPKPVAPPHVVSSPSHNTPSHHSYHQSPRPGPQEVSQPGPPTPSQQTQQQATQPVEFNHAINYVNKIKNRFQGQPEIYKQFLEILHTYQKEQRTLKEGSVPQGYKPLTESEVYSQVAKLFQNQEDLLTEFGQFLPDANGTSNYMNSCGNWPDVDHTHSIFSKNDSSLGVRNDHSSTVKKSGFNNKSQSNKNSGQLKRPSSGSQPAPKKQRTSSLKDISIAEAAKSGDLQEFAYFDKVRRALKNQEVYDNFLRCLILFNQEVVSREELVLLIQNFLGKFPELLKEFKSLVNIKEKGGGTEAVPQGATSKERISGELAMEIDFNSCKRYGASYRALPPSYPQPKCSGRTTLCREVLNDTWVSFPSWSEDSQFVTSRKTQYEECIYRCEDERFELDYVLGQTMSTIHVLEAINKKMEQMTADDAAKFHLDNCLGGRSEVIHRKAIQRIYGDKAREIIEGLKKNPIVAVPLVLRRLKAKAEEWRQAQKAFNKIWHEQNEKYYLKSLDHQGQTFKPNDMKAIRCKALMAEIDAILDERQEQAAGLPPEEAAPILAGPHLTYVYKDKSLNEDVTNLIIHHMKRQTGIHKEDKTKIKQLLHQFFPDIFFLARGELSDDEQEKDDESDERDKADGPSEEDSNVPKQEEASVKSESDSQGAQAATPMVNGDLSEDNSSDEYYSLVFVNSSGYLFLRLHNILCDRLHKIYVQTQSIIEEDNRFRAVRGEEAAVALRLKHPLEVEPCQYYTYFLEMVKNLLDGNLDSSTYEDNLRELFGIHAYIAFTMDKIVQQLVRQLQYLVTDQVGQKVTDLYYCESKHGATGGRLATQHQRTAAESAYQRKAEQGFTEDSVYKIYFYKKESKLTMEVLDTEPAQSDDPSEVEKWSTYIDRFVVADDSLVEELKAHLEKKPVFLLRNIANCKGEMKIPTEETEAEQDVDKDKENELPQKRTKGDLQLVEEMGCKININSYKMVFVVNSESIIYKRGALKTARQIHKRLSLRRHTKFNDWVNKWRRDNVAEEQETITMQWLMGKVDNLRPSKTTVQKLFNSDKPPYYQYNRYGVEYFEPPKPAANEKE